MTDDSINGDFNRATRAEGDSQLVLLIDGSGGMGVAAYGGGGPNPFDVAVNYAADAYKRDDSVRAFTFGEFTPRPEIPLHDAADPMKFFQGGPSNLKPALDDVLARHAAGDISDPAHLLIVSDGEISESNSSETEKITAAIAEFLRRSPESRFDVIVPGQENSGLVRIMKDVAAQVPGNPPRVFVVNSSEKLNESIAAIVNEHENRDTFAKLAQVAVKGLDEKVAVMPTLRFRRPETA